MGQRMLRVAIVGADSLAGRDLLESLYDDSFPMEEPRLFTLGEEVGWRGLLQQELAPLGFTRASALIGAI